MRCRPLCWDTAIPLPEASQPLLAFQISWTLIGYPLVDLFQDGLTGLWKSDNLCQRDCASLWPSCNYHLVGHMFAFWQWILLFPEQWWVEDVIHGSFSNLLLIYHQIPSQSHKDLMWPLSMLLNVWGGGKEGIHKDWPLWMLPEEDVAGP